MGWNVQNNGAKSVSPNFFENSFASLEQLVLQKFVKLQKNGNSGEINNSLGKKTTFI